MCCVTDRFGLCWVMWMVCNCSRYLNGMSAKSELGMGPEQMLFSEASGSTRGLSQEAQSLSNLSRLPAVNNKSWHTMTSSKVPPAPQPKSSANSSLLNYNSSQMRGLLGQDFGLMPETSQVNLTAMAASQQQQQQQQQQQHSFLSNGYGGVEAVSVGRESEGQPLRHFFDDWPRSRADPSALAWGSDVEDSERTNARTGGGGNNNNHSHAGGNGGGSGANSNSNSNSTHNNNNSNNNTQLSISIPITAPSSDFPSQSSGGSPPRGKLSLSPLKLSMSRAGVEADPTSSYMGLGVGLGGADHDHDVDVDDDDLIRHRQTTWIPIAWDSQTTTHHHHIIPVGGPLAEVLHGGHGAVTVGSDVCKSSGLNLTCNEESWLDDDDDARNHKQQSPGHLASPIDVLHHSTFTSFSDSSTSTSSGSSPRTTLPQQENTNNNKNNNNNSNNNNNNSSVVAPPSQDPNPRSPILTTEPAASPLA
jgi:hypothetical protein